MAEHKTNLYTQKRRFKEVHATSARPPLQTHPKFHTLLLSGRHYFMEQNSRNGMEQFRHIISRNGAAVPAVLHECTCTTGVQCRFVR